MNQELLQESVAEAAADHALLTQDYSEIAEAAEYRGRKVTLYKPFRNPDGPAKFSVYVKKPGKDVSILHFGSKEMSIKRDDPERRKSFRARFKCDEGYGPKWEKKYWNCKTWEASRTVKDVTG